MLDECLMHCVGGVVLCISETCSGICLDFWSVQHTCIQNTCGCGRAYNSEDDSSENREQEPLIRDTEPGRCSPMQK
ncbi:hypothetical protein C8Q77DRAFT_1061620 [Trametes polyzona]|nr:hypothetical protein C8Q77DRAFT_1061620 [Trametes polyzona]